MQTLVLKFGGAAVSNPDRFSAIADIILKKKLEHQGVVVVVSAMANMTDQLIELARSVHPNPPQRELDMLISIGERASISLLSMAIQAKGGKAISFTGSQSGIVTTSEHTQAKILDVRPYRINHYLNQDYIVIIAGFQGVSLEKEITTLGRGGSDTSAVAVAIALEAKQVEFYKDVRGVYEEDPKRNPKAALLPFLSYEEALKLMKPPREILHPRCLRLAQQNDLPLIVRSFEDQENSGTCIGYEQLKKSGEKIYEAEA